MAPSSIWYLDKIVFIYFYTVPTIFESVIKDQALPTASIKIGAFCQIYVRGMSIALSYQLQTDPAVPRKSENIS